MTTEMTLAAIQQDGLARVVESLVTRGDVSMLSPIDRARHYVKMCEDLGLNPHTQPFAFLRLNGKEVMYATRGATDQLAAAHRLNREIIDGPKIVDVLGAKIGYCACKATHPNGRVETATATLPAVDPVNLFMKLETKAKRRATLSILGLGMLDEMELETIPAHVQEPSGGVDVSIAKPRALPSPSDEADEDARREREAIQGECAPPTPAPAPSAFARLRAGLERVRSLDDMTKLWGPLGKPLNDSGDATEAKKFVTEHLFDLGYPLTAAQVTAVLAGTMPDAFRAALDGLATLSPARPLDDAAAVVRDLRPQLHPNDQAEAMRAAVRRLDQLGITDAKTALAAKLEERPAGQPADVPAALVAFNARVDEIDLPGEAVAVWIKCRSELAPLPAAQREAAWKALCEKTEEVGRMKNAKVWLKKAIAEEDARRNGPEDDGPRGGGQRPAALANTSAIGTAAQGSQEGGAQALSAELRRMVAHWRSKPERGEDRGAASVAGSWWAHLDEVEALPRADQARALALVLDELTRRGVTEPHSWLDEIGAKNGAVVRRAA